MVIVIGVQTCVGVSAHIDPAWAKEEHERTPHQNTGISKSRAHTGGHLRWSPALGR